MSRSALHRLCVAAALVLGVPATGLAAGPSEDLPLAVPTAKSWAAPQIASVVLAAPAARRLRTLGRPGWGAGTALGLLLALGYGLQTAGLERTTVSSAGFITMAAGPLGTSLGVVPTPARSRLVLPRSTSPRR